MSSPFPPIERADYPKRCDNCGLFVIVESELAERRSRAKWERALAKELRNFKETYVLVLTIRQRRELDATIAELEKQAEADGK